MNQLAERLRKERLRCGISQKMVSLKIGFSQSNVSEWEHGTKKPTLQTLLKLAEMYGVTTDYLLGKEETPIRLTEKTSSYTEATPFEKQLIAAYRDLPEAEQRVVCRSLGLTHPAAMRDKAKKA